MAFTDQAALALDGVFRSKVRNAIIYAAEQIQGETPTAKPVVDQKRAALADAILKDGGSNKLDAFSWGCAGYGSLTAQSSDSDIQFVVNTIWNDLADITGEDLG